ncbi:hypothetical protein G4Y79_12970 [Phototrophicus methaneseepsis]|uniref:Uncharacterized protein n=1 Tax=Phototrophicus methaneseepsis TaxID=2710758 RepID=A0A7S8IDB7_9CHLR|nr:hypothetical protein [Phototrophicus methaneseepsis]QPC80623.1 hypothetical protein G4Y79_12970 [Phototrophicus methaneseepsis]
MRRLFPTPIRKWMRRHEKGQSLILLAIAFMALIAFVGITADVAILFARYSQLSRAVDSAAIAAANQMREDREYPHVRLAATQFIEFYGLDPEEVDVQYCETLPVDMQTPGDDELCTEDQRKLVRVTARITVDTIFGGLPFWPDRIELEASSVSETAALDVILILDVSESMLRYTTVEDWAGVGQGAIYRPPTINEILTRIGNNTSRTQLMQTGYGGNGPDRALLHLPQNQVNAKLSYKGDGVNEAGTEQYFDVVVDLDYFSAQMGERQTQPRDECRVRFFPGSYLSGIDSFLGYYDDTTATYAGLSDLYQKAGLTYTTNRFEGFVPTYNFYGCCNDPNGDWNFDDLICQPFLQAREATDQFLDRIDFMRGDRVAFVTFDRSAFLLNPYGIPVVGGVPRADLRQSAMIDNLDDAKAVVQNLVGVRSEPNFYVYEPNTYTEGAVNARTAGWVPNVYAAGLDENGESIVFNPEYNSTYTPGAASNSEAYNYPVRGNCPFMNAVLPGSLSLFGESLLRITNPLGSEWNNYVDSSLSSGGKYIVETDPRKANLAMSYEYWSSCRGTNIGAALRVANNALVDPDTIRTEGVWIMVLLSDGGAGASDAVRRNGDKVKNSDPYLDVNGDATLFGKEGDYGFFGVCPYGTPSRTAELMHPGDDEPEATFPHCSDESWYSRHRCDFRPLRVAQGEDSAMQDSEYVTYGTVGGPSSPEDELQWNLDRNNLYDIDIGQPTQCDVGYYDVDDYARDWADVIGLQQIVGSGQEAQLPTIFTIGFGLEYPEREAANGRLLNIDSQSDSVEICSRNPADCLGEMLLRYIADVGDNNYLDNDYYQDLMFNDVGDYAGSLDLNYNNEGTAGDPRGYGERGPCQTEFGYSFTDYDTNNDGLSPSEKAVQREMLPPQVSCGNYYFAPDGNELRFVFDDIASRMYTRLAR